MAGTRRDTHLSARGRGKKIRPSVAARRLLYMKPAILASARLEAIFIAESRGLPMSRVNEVEAVAGRGLCGDRYYTGHGYYSRADPCQVTLIEGEALEIMQALYGVHVWSGEHRRNLVTYGISLRDLAGWTFQIGEVEFAYDR